MQITERMRIQRKLNGEDKSCANMFIWANKNDQRAMRMRHDDVTGACTTNRNVNTRTLLARTGCQQ